MIKVTITRKNGEVKEYNSKHCATEMQEEPQTVYEMFGFMHEYEDLDGNGPYEIVKIVIARIP